VTDREFEFTARDFERIKQMIYRRAGIALGPAKQNMAYSRLSRRLRACAIERFCDYLDRLEASADTPEWEAFVNALTTNLTSFFRESHHFPILEAHLRQRRAESPTLIWCSAASTGEEPYSIAITACEAFGTLTPPVRIVASDIDTQVLATAERGVYPAERVASMPSERLRRYFKRGTAANAGLVRVRPEVRALVEFRRVNLLDAQWNIAANLAAIFCRNVLIYFDRSTQLRIVTRFAPLLADDGLLFAGHSESLAYANRTFRLRGKTVYEKLAAAAAG
jgi:chemotaxis protein methyltransferase CheR